jgi:hypothetical protein
MSAETLQEEIDDERVLSEAAELAYQDFVLAARIRLADILGVEQSAITNSVLIYLLADEDEDSVRTAWASKPWSQGIARAANPATIQQIQRSKLGL